MFATIRNLIPEPRQADQPRNYVGRHRQPETVSARATVPTPGPAEPAAQPTMTAVIAPAPTSTVPAGSQHASLATVSFLIPAQGFEPATIQPTAPAPRRTPSPRPAPEAQPATPADDSGEGTFPQAV